MNNDWIVDGKRPENKNIVFVILRQTGFDENNKEIPVTFLKLSSYDPEKKTWENIDDKFVLAWKYADIYPLPDGIELSMGVFYF